MTGGLDFHADLEALSGLVGRLRDFERRAAELETELERDASRLEAQWFGAAADDHAVAHRRWVAAHERLRGAADRLANRVEVAHTNYRSAAVTNTRMWA